MDSKSNHFKKWFGFDRRERRATLILLLIIAIVFVSRYMVPGKPAEIKNLTTEISEYKPVLPLSENILTDSAKLIPVDSNKPTLIKPALQQKQVKMMDLNTCDSIMLDMLPGIGPVLSARIVKYKNLLGGYASKNQLNEVYGLSPETFALISEMVYADSLVIKRIKINQAAYKDLIRHPYFETIEVVSIIKYKELKGHITDINELIENNILTKEKAKKISPYLSFE